jgi:hypothetical protein
VPTIGNLPHDHYWDLANQSKQHETSKRAVINEEPASEAVVPKVQALYTMSESSNRCHVSFNSCSSSLGPVKSNALDPRTAYLNDGNGRNFGNGGAIDANDKLLDLSVNEKRGG